MELNVEFRTEGIARSGHSSVWMQDRLLAFGGIPNWERREEDPELFAPTGCEFAGMMQWTFASQEWSLIPSDDFYPKSRHGHVMMPRSDGRILILGGHHWAFANEQPIHELEFNLSTRKFTMLSLMVPNRFAASWCPCPSVSGVKDPLECNKLLLFGGLNELRELCNDLVAVDLANNAAFIQPAFGTPPPPQFKGAMVLNAAGTASFVFDGYTEAGVQKVFMLSATPSGELVWRAVATGAPLVRFAAAPIYGGRMVALIGGMERRKGQRRTDKAHIFDVEECRWVGVVEVQGFGPRTAHTVVPVPTSSTPFDTTGALVAYGGCEDIDDNPNNRGRTVGTVFVIDVKQPTLKYLATVALWKMFPAERWLPTGDSDEKDDVLDELF